MAQNTQKDISRRSKLSSVVAEMKSIDNASSDLVSDLTEQFENITLFKLSKAISLLAKEKEDLKNHISDIKPVLSENNIKTNQLYNYILSGNNIGILSELYTMTQEIGAEDMYSSIIAEGKDSIYLKNSSPGSVNRYLAIAILKFSSILEDTRDIERTISGLYGSINTDKISKHLEFLSSNGLLSLGSKTLDIPMSSPEKDIQESILSSLKNAEAKLSESKKENHNESKKEVFPTASFEERKEKTILPTIDEIISTDPIIFGNETTSKSLR